MFKIKRLVDGKIDRRKAHLVAQGFSQVEGVDYGMNYSPVNKFATIRIVLSITVRRGWSVQLLDIHNAFLHGDLKERAICISFRGIGTPHTPTRVVCFTDLCTSCSSTLVCGTRNCETSL